MKKRILVVGSEGNIGSELVPYLTSLGHSVFCTDIKQDYRDNYLVCDINNPMDLIYEMDKFKPEIIVHLAAMVSRVTCETSPSITVDTNLGGLNNIISLCKLHDSKLIYFSTSEIYGNIGGVLTEDRADIQPNNRYGLTKLLGEKLVEYEVKNNNLKAVTLRPFMFYHENESFGDNRSAMIRFVLSALNRTPIEVHKGAKRSWLHLSDAICLIEKTFYIPTYEIINIASNEIVEIEEMAQTIASKTGEHFDSIFFPISLPSKMTLEKIPSTEKMDKLLNYTPKISLDLGLDLVINKVKKRKQLL